LGKTPSELEGRGQERRRAKAQCGGWIFPGIKFSAGWAWPSVFLKLWWVIEKQHLKIFFY
jgi:hypothetical protein